MSAQNPPRDERALRRELSTIGGRLRALETTPKRGPVTTSELTATGDASVAGGLAVNGAGGLAVSGGATLGTLDVGGLASTEDLAVAGTAEVDVLDANQIIVGGVNIAPFLDPPYGTFVKGGNQTVTDSNVVSVMAYTAPIAGYYGLTASVPWTNDPAGRREANFRVNGATYQGSSIHISSNTLPINSLAMLAAMGAGQTAEVVVWQNSGGTLQVTGGTRLEAIWRRPL